MTFPTKRPAAHDNAPLGLRSPHLATASVVALAGMPIAKLLYEAFGIFNAKLFDGELAPGLVLITQAKSSRTFGDYIKRDVHGLESRIRIAPSAVKRGELFAIDVLIHEMVHAWQEEIDGNGEDGYRGHGPRFAAKCNEIGAKLGLPPVGVKGRDGLPDCAQWPLNVRPAGYYPQPFVASTRAPKAPRAPAAPAPEVDEEAERQAKLLRAVHAFVAALPELDDTDLRDVAMLIVEELKQREGSEFADAAE